MNKAVPGRIVENHNYVWSSTALGSNIISTTKEGPGSS